MLGKLTHYAFDAVLLSAFLAGMKRSTGLTCVYPYTFLRAIILRNVRQVVHMLNTSFLIWRYPALRKTSPKTKSSTVGSKNILELVNG
ncbi:hypothetical protein EYC84_007118 [Monilinia fructicola]|uniref:DUF1748-domain-containing protein n=1 Tax=Monilinia fructicola TaxID=38448 RepID=A0A5M9K8A4_MONFR|nr:hypothetical protein EYC84_007118 [Monilinia fructicola]